MILGDRCRGRTKGQQSTKGGKRGIWLRQHHQHCQQHQHCQHHQHCKQHQHCQHHQHCKHHQHRQQHQHCQHRHHRHRQPQLRWCLRATQPCSCDIFRYFQLLWYLISVITHFYDICHRYLDLCTDHLWITLNKKLCSNVLISTLLPDSEQH